MSVHERGSSSELAPLRRFVVEDLDDLRAAHADRRVTTMTHRDAGARTVDLEIVVD